MVMESGMKIFKSSGRTQGADGALKTLAEFDRLSLFVACHPIIEKYTEPVPLANLRLRCNLEAHFGRDDDKDLEIATSIAAEDADDLVLQRNLVELGIAAMLQLKQMESAQVRTSLLGALKHYVLKESKGYAKNLQVEVYDVILVLRASQEEMLRKDQWERLDKVLREVEAARPEQPMTFTGLLSVNQTHGAVFFAGAKTAVKQVQKYRHRLEELNKLEKCPSMPISS